MRDVPYGYCHCGCGQKTNICEHTDRRRDERKGEPYRFLRGHNQRAEPIDTTIVGYCGCGCGQTTKLARQTTRALGYVRGQPMRFVLGHNAYRRPPHELPYRVDDETGCWVWLGGMNGVGYGKLNVDGRYVYAHRHYYERAKGPIPEGLQIDHLCRNRSCVNPDHLEPVTASENIRRAKRAKAA